MCRSQHSCCASLSPCCALPRTSSFLSLSAAGVPCMCFRVCVCVCEASVSELAALIFPASTSPSPHHHHLSRYRLAALISLLYLPCYNSRSLSFSVLLSIIPPLPVSSFIPFLHVISFGLYMFLCFVATSTFV